ncbi:hypothetical protein ACB092_06G135500 [Castanea dentata]
MWLLQNIIDLITCVVAAIYNFSKIVKLLMAQRMRGRRGGIRGNQMDVGEGVEANLLVGRNGGKNQNIEKGYEIVELRSQVASLVELVQWSLKLTDFVDWLNTVERMFDYYEVMDEKKVKLVAICLKGRAFSWWKRLQIFRQRSGLVKIKSWEKMKKKLHEKFLPFNYTQSLYKDLHNLKQEGSVEECTEMFSVDLNESEEQMVARYLSGLKPSIQDVLSLQSSWNMLKVYNHALLVEKQQTRPAVVDKLKLATQDHPHSYKLSRYKKGNELKVTKRCLVPFSIRKKYFDKCYHWLLQQYNDIFPYELSLDLPPIQYIQRAID